MQITEQERDAVYKTIFSRRDVRGQFTDQPVAKEVLGRILKAAHHAPSVGFMQPWDFIVVKNQETKRQIKKGFVEAHEHAANLFSGKQQEIYRTLKLEGIEEAPLGICITCDRQRTGPVVIGRTANLEMDLYSAVCAVQNLWLAARAENIGVGWVSIIDNKVLRKNLGIPEEIDIIAYLCLGHVSHFKDAPELESIGWLPRRDMASVVHEEKWSPEKAQKK